jgi:hypothetical protein
MTTLHLTLGIVLLTSGALSAAQHPTMPAGMSHEEHLRQLRKDEALKQRGALAMGFDQDKTEHHFLLRKNGGAIVVTRKDPADAESLAQIRAHFRDIARSFADGAFDTPVATHGELPPGAAAMAAGKARITYRYEERPDGASVVIETADATVLAAIHEFLRYQIVEHRTGDPLTAPR